MMPDAKNIVDMTLWVFSLGVVNFYPLISKLIRSKHLNENKK